MSSSKIFSIEAKGLKLDEAADLAPYVKELVSNEHVEEVHFQGNTLGIGASEALANILKTKKKLRFANLADIFTSRLVSEIPPSITFLLTALASVPTLETIDLSNNAFGIRTAAPLVDFLSIHTPLRHLFLSNNGLGPEAGTLIADALTSLAEKKKATANGESDSAVQPLETLACSRNRLENGSMKAWARCLTAHGHLREVRMEQNGIGREGITLLLRDGLSKVTGLRVLDLQDNTFTSKGARSLAYVIGIWSELKVLGVGDCLLSRRGGELLTEALRRGDNAQLEVLRLGFNDIDVASVKMLVTSLLEEKLPNLRRAELNGNMFLGEPVVDKLKEILEERMKNAEKNGLKIMDLEWGLDELDELQEDDSGSESEDDDEQEGEEQEDDEQEDEDVQGAAQQKQKETDELDGLGALMKQSLTIKDEETEEKKKR